MNRNPLTGRTCFAVGTSDLPRSRLRVLGQVRCQKLRKLVSLTENTVLPNSLLRFLQTKPAADHRASSECLHGWANTKELSVTLAHDEMYQFYQHKIDLPRHQNSASLILSATFPMKCESAGKLWNCATKAASNVAPETGGVTMTGVDDGEGSKGTVEVGVTSVFGAALASDETLDLATETRLFLSTSPHELSIPDSRRTRLQSWKRPADLTTMRSIAHPHKRLILRRLALSVIRRSFSSRSSGIVAPLIQCRIIAIFGSKAVVQPCLQPQPELVLYKR